MRPQTPSLLDRLLDTLCEFFSSSVSNPRTDSDTSSNPQHNTERNQEPCKDSTFKPLRVVIEELPPPPPPPVARETREVNQDVRDQRRLTIETVCAFAAIFGVVATIFTLFLTRSAAISARRSADAANASVKTAEKATWINNRAWVNISAPQQAVNLIVGQPISVPIQLDNTGSTPASKFFGKTKLRVLPKGEQPDISQHDYGYGLQIPVLVGHFHQIIPIPAIDGKTGEQEIFTPERARGLTNGSLFMVVWGRLDYIDYRNVPHWIQFCQALGHDPPQVPTCSDYNQIDENEP